jgi:hypothetical protein
MGRCACNIVDNDDDDWATRVVVACMRAPIKSRIKLSRLSATSSAETNKFVTRKPGSDVRVPQIIVNRHHF